MNNLIITPNIIGNEAKKLYSAAAADDRPDKLPAIIVEPDRDTPGMNDRIWAKPIAIARNGPSFSPLSIVLRRLLYIALGRRFIISAGLKTLEPYRSAEKTLRKSVGAGLKLVTALIAWSLEMLALMVSL